MKLSADKPCAQKGCSGRMRRAEVDAKDVESSLYYLCDTCRTPMMPDELDRQLQFLRQVNDAD